MCLQPISWVAQVQTRPNELTFFISLPHDKTLILRPQSFFVPVAVTLVLLHHFPAPRLSQQGPGWSPVPWLTHFSRPTQCHEMNLPIAWPGSCYSSAEKGSGLTTACVPYDPSPPPVTSPIPSPALSPATCLTRLGCCQDPSSSPSFSCGRAFVHLVL